MDIRDWAPNAWVYLHAVTLSYPEAPTEQERHAYRQFFTSVGQTLPCRACCEHYTDQLASNPPQLASRDTLVRWLIDIHNGVRKSQGKRILGHAEALRHIKSSPRLRRAVAVVMVSLVIVAAFAVAACAMIMHARARR
jgi:hypothetical protein